MGEEDNEEEWVKEADRIEKLGARDALEEDWVKEAAKIEKGNEQGQEAMTEEDEEEEEDAEAEDNE